jgi:hypothetical protein
MQLIYNVLYIALIAFSFLVIPFAYFYYVRKEKKFLVFSEIYVKLINISFRRRRRRMLLLVKRWPGLSSSLLSL